MESTDEAICIGEELLTLNSKPKGRALIPLEALKRHLCILGTTGSGKSTCAAIICRELHELRVPVLILDRTGEYAETLGPLPGATVLKPGENLVISLFKPDESKKIRSQIEDWISLLDHFNHVSHSAGLSPLQARVLREVFGKYYHGTRECLTISGLIAKLEQYEREVRDLNGWPESIEALISRLWPMTVDAIGAALDRPHGTFTVTGLLEPRLSVIDLSDLADDRAKDLFSQVVLEEVYEAVREAGKSEALRLVVLIDEAQHLAPNERGYISIPEKCAIELRKYGFCLAMCATRPCLISPNVIANSNTLISFMLNNQDDIETVAGFLVGGGREHVRDMLRRLPVGEALVQLNHPQPRDVIRSTIRSAEQIRTLR